MTPRRQRTTTRRQGRTMTRVVDQPVDQRPRSNASLAGACRLILQREAPSRAVRTGSLRLLSPARSLTRTDPLYTLSATPPTRSQRAGEAQARQSLRAHSRAIPWLTGSTGRGPRTGRTGRGPGERQLRRQRWWKTLGAWRRPCARRRGARAVMRSGMEGRQGWKVRGGDGVVGGGAGRRWGGRAH
jgi:hypothetical protein